MKKIVLIVFSLLCFCGIGYLGYMIFNAKSIKTVEIVGNMQTIYVVNEAIYPDFENAELKITYKNGSVKMVKPTTDNVEVKSFSTSLKTHGTMKLVYKSEVIDVDYNVVNKGFYYTSLNVTTGPEETLSADEKSYSRFTSPLMFHIGDDGVLEYYYKDGSNYHMHDGNYDSTYRYEMVADEMLIYLGGENPDYRLKAIYNPEGVLTLKSVTFKTSSTDPDIIVSKTEKTYKFYENFKTNRRVSTISVDLSKTVGYEENAVNFTVNSTIKSSGKIILLNVTYGNDNFLKTVYVHVTDKMITRNSFDTSKVSGIAHVMGVYEGVDFDFAYRVKNG